MSFCAVGDRPGAFPLSPVTVACRLSSPSITLLIVLKPDARQTYARAAARIVGTIAGVALATLIAMTLRPGAIELAALVVLFAWLSYAFLYANYAVYAMCITGYVVFLLSFGGLPERTVVIARAVNTLIGGLLGVAVYLLGPRGSPISGEPAVSNQPGGGNTSAG